MKTLIIDNYDSFTYNLYQYVGEVLEEKNKVFTVDVFRNDEKSYEEIKSAAYDRIIISPGPGHPADAKYFGVCTHILENATKDTHFKILGVCLGMQGMAHIFGGKVVKAHQPMHGKTSPIKHDAKGVFAGLPQGIEVMRYHSLIAEEASLPPSLEITARTADGSHEIMGLRHKTLPIEGIQFHPESFATEGGKVMLRNFLSA
ncbi:MAG TPA: aminodeoxychorismate/anthranilate synthase component II [Turneriella sp.]|nr:aminodeoxychorismate/anthranilate synthase component II [Turneriella sp.]